MAANVVLQEEQFVCDSLQNALFLDSFTSSHPIQAQVKNPAEINEIFDKISYDKVTHATQWIVNSW